MKSNVSLVSGLAVLLLMLVSNLKAAHLDGLWRNQRQNITVRIEQDNDGFRAKRTDQGVWYRYSLKKDYYYVDRYGNSYEIIDQDEIEWREAGTNKRLLFTKVDSDDYRDRNRPDDQWGRNDDFRANSFEGRWNGQSSRDQLTIRESNGEYSVRSQNGSWEQFYADRNGSRIRSRSGAVIQMIDRNKISMSIQGRNERIFVRDASSVNDDRYGRNDRTNDRDDWDDRYDKNDRNSKGSCGKGTAQRSKHDNGRHLGHYKNGKRS